ncbi:MAG: class I SAM-dependent methyltransferase [Burkholderiales bacterium]|nr:class I SAM-dependent methyltransferase [Burkholderiales bacterium]
MANKFFIDEKLYSYILEYGIRDNPILKELRQETALLHNGKMQITAEQAQFMGFLAKITNAKKYLEFGVFTGYSSLSMALAMGNDSQSVCLEKNENYIQIARKYWTKAGVNERIKVLHDDALKSCEYLIKNNYLNYFDFAFIDSDKNNIMKYYEYCLLLVKSGGIIVIDNVLFHGEVAQENKSTFANSIHELNKLIQLDNRVEMSLIPIADGLSLIYKK